MYIYLMLVLQIILRELDRYIIDKGQLWLSTSKEYIVLNRVSYRLNPGFGYQYLGQDPRIKMLIIHSSAKNQ